MRRCIQLFEAMPRRWCPELDENALEPGAAHVGSTQERLKLKRPFVQRHQLGRICALFGRYVRDRVLQSKRSRLRAAVQRRQLLLEPRDLC